MYKSRMLVGAMVALMVVGLLVGCQPKVEPQPQAKPLTEVRVAEVIHSVFYTPQYVAYHKDYFKEEGLDVKIGIAWGADKGAAALLSGNADIGLFGPEAAVYIAQQGAENNVVAFAQLTKRDGSFLVARPGTENFKWTDTKGKIVIGGRKGGVPQMVLEHIVRLNGMVPQKDVEIIQNIALDATATAFAGGIGDYVQVWEPAASQLETAGKGKIVASLGKDGGEVPYTVFHATANYIKKNPQVVQSFTNAVYRAQKWVDQNSAAEVAKVIAPQFPDTDMALLAKVVQRYKDLDIWAKDPVFTTQALENLQKIMIEAGELTEAKKVTHSSMVNNQFAEAAMKK